jgi:hypothetical protein
MATRLDREMALASRPTRRRARRWLLVGVLAAVVALAVAGAVGARSSAPARQLAQQNYLDRVFPVIQDSTEQGHDISALRTQADSLSLTMITGRLDQLVASTGQSFSAVRRIEPPASLDTAHDLLVATLAVRADSAKALRQEIANALGGQPSTAAVQAINSVGMEMEASDRIYQLFIHALPSPSSPGTTPPASQWVRDPSVYDEAHVGAFLSGLTAKTSPAPGHDVAVVLVLTDPGPVSLNGSTQVLPVSRLLNLQIVVANTGSERERNLAVSATMSPSATGPRQMLRDLVDLSPGQRRTVSLGGLRAKPNQPTTLTINIDAAPGETNLADNTKTVTFVMQ